MLESKAVIGETDMFNAMQVDTVKFAGKTLDEFETSGATGIARFVKKCVVGTNFGSFVTHHCGCFIYFGIESLAISLFRGGANPEAEKGRAIAMEVVQA